MLRTLAGVTELQRPAEDRLGLAVAIEVAVEQTQIVHALERVGITGSENVGPTLQDLLVQALGIPVSAYILVQQREGERALERIAMPGTQLLLAQLARSFM